MKQTLEQLLRDAVSDLQDTGELAPTLQPVIQIERTKDRVHGDFSTNLALLLAKSARKAPRQVAEAIISRVPLQAGINRVEIAGPGFINFFLNNDALACVIPRVLEQGVQYGCSNQGLGKKILVEFVSANPTGPLHVGHGRGAAYGASLCNLLSAAGFEVTREYYVNDAGRQMLILAVSVWLRYLELADAQPIFPVNAYRGDYVIDIARTAWDANTQAYAHPWAVISEGLPLDETDGGDKERYIDALIARAQALLGKEGFEYFHALATDSVLSDIKADLSEFGVNFDSWFSEQSLFTEGAIEQGIEAMKKTGHTYLQDGALWFKATAFGDEKDRVLVRANGNTTYFASDVAYHWNKYHRNFDRIIDIFGADHHGYISRLRAVVTALGYDAESLRVLLVQFAILYRAGERVQMSTRSGSFVTLRALREEVGKDAARFFYVMRKSEQHLDFDLDLATSQSSDNPVYYIQYAHARICSVLKQLAQRGLSSDDALGLLHLGALDDVHEKALITLLDRYPEMIHMAAESCEPHQIAYYLRELANGLHSYYNAVQLLCEDTATRCARLCLLKAVRQVLFNGLTLLGVSTPESM